MNVQKLKKLAAMYDWQYKDHQKNIGMVSFVKIINKEPARINVYLTKMTVSSSIYHPKQGRTQLHRKLVTDELMEKIFKNPRVHTGTGYQRKN